MLCWTSLGLQCELQLQPTAGNCCSKGLDLQRFFPICSSVIVCFPELYLGESGGKPLSRSTCIALGPAAVWGVLAMPVCTAGVGSPLHLLIHTVAKN